MQQTWIVGAAEDCNIRITDDPYVSSEHCRVELRADGTAWLDDLGSMNGTWVRLTPTAPKIRVYGPTRVRPGAVLVVGRTEFPWKP